MTLKKRDQAFVNENVLNEVLNIFKAQNHKLITGQRKRATLPNTENHFLPLDRLEDRLNKLHDSPVMKHAVEYCDKED